MSKITTCSCGKTMTYTTRKPQKCAECKQKEKAPATKSKGRRYPKNMQTKGELLLFAVLDDIIKGEYINHGFYSILLSPKYQPLQIDRYYPKYRLGFEYDGRQHDEYIKYIHKNRKNFTYQKECDKIKDRECKVNGITLIRISHKEKITTKLITEKIQAANPELYTMMLKEGMLRHE